MLEDVGTIHELPLYIFNNRYIRNYQSGMKRCDEVRLRANRWLPVRLHILAGRGGG